MLREDLVGCVGDDEHQYAYEVEDRWLAFLSFGEGEEEGCSEICEADDGCDALDNDVDY